MTPIALTIAGSDSGGGAGIQADLKTFSALGVYGASVISAITAQNTVAVTAVHSVPTEIIAAQISAVFDDLKVNAVKVGMLASSEIIESVADGLKDHVAPLVLDPVMVSKSGDALLRDDAVETLCARLLPMADLVTPNLPEAARILKQEQAQNDDEIEAQGRAILAMGAKADNARSND
jgi:hydroxymethylpyrimidine/phosphomethylpyrimidine kinase